MITLENSKLIVTAKEVGAELTRIYDKEHQRECLWTGDPEFWRQQAPTLFPVVGRCKNYEYRYKGQTYHMGQHGFVREATFEVESQSDEQVVFVYRANVGAFDEFMPAVYVGLYASLWIERCAGGYRILRLHVFADDLFIFSRSDCR